MRGHVAEAVVDLDAAEQLLLRIAELTSEGDARGITLLFGSGRLRDGIVDAGGAAHDAHTDTQHHRDDCSVHFARPPIGQRSTGDTVRQFFYNNTTIVPLTRVSSGIGRFL
jgi:hypothetical protein